MSIAFFLPRWTRHNVWGASATVRPNARELPPGPRCPRAQTRAEREPSPLRPACAVRGGGGSGERASLSPPADPQILASRKNHDREGFGRFRPPGAFNGPRERQKKLGMKSRSQGRSLGLWGPFQLALGPRSARWRSRTRGGVSGSGPNAWSMWCLLCPEFGNKRQGGVTPADNRESTPVAGNHRAPKAPRPQSQRADEARLPPVGGYLSRLSRKAE